MPSADWTAPTATGPVDARVVLPGSKSLTNRYLVLAALASDVSLLRSPLRSRDTLLMAQALRTLGVEVDDDGRGALPFTIAGHGSVRGGAVTLDASASSQFVSGLLLSGARFD